MSSLRAGFAKGLREIRTARKKSQEDFPDVASRAYMSILERGLKSPTLDKLEVLADALGVHPVTLLAMAYVNRKGDVEKLVEIVKQEIGEITGVELSADQQPVKRKQ